MSALVAYLLLFSLVGFGFIWIHLVIGRFIRPDKPNTEKLEAYECGEPTIGSNWVQFDLRFYVIALLFIVFDVELAFFFPWATVFGQAAKVNGDEPALAQAAATQLASATEGVGQGVDGAAAQSLVGLAFVDLFVFFAVILVGFAYVWKRGDLEWVRATSTGPTGPAPQ